MAPWYSAIPTPRTIPESARLLVTEFDSGIMAPVAHTRRLLGNAYPEPGPSEVDPACPPLICDKNGRRHRHLLQMLVLEIGPPLGRTVR
jgi:hypothetical protein